MALSGSEKAFKDGQAARADGKQRAAVPSGYRTAPGLERAWKKGWDDAGRFVSQPAALKTPDPVTTTREERWPEGQPLPEAYVRPRPVPCAKCRLVRMGTGAQAVLMRTFTGGIAYLWCRSCGNQFKMRIQ